MSNEIKPAYEHEPLNDIMSKSYIDYAMSVITSRALPDVRDGLKPVQRRILWAMYELNNTPDKPHRKCARIVGDTMGKYHPHGDSSIYGALVTMAQDFNMRIPLVDGHGNFGSVDGDGAAAMRYTEARLSKLAMEMIRDIGENTVDMADNFDGTEQEPSVLPARFPNLLVNGAVGIAVGMATNIPSHNLGEVVDACVRMLNNDNKGKETSIEELMECVQGPDFPTGAVILGDSWKEVYRTGKGKIKMEAVYHSEVPKGGKKENIIITEIPYGVNKAALVKKMADLVKNKKLDVADVRDETSREGTRIVVELKRNANSGLIMNEFLKNTELRCDFSANMNCLVNNVPRVLNLYEFIRFYLDHQEEVITRRTRFRLQKAQDRKHIVDGLLIAIDHIDEIIKIVRSSKDVAQAKVSLMERFGFSDVQAQTIVDMRIRSLTGMEKQKLADELAELIKRIAFLTTILNDKKELRNLLKKELKEMKKKFNEPRRTGHEADPGEIMDIDLVPDEPVIIMRSNVGYIKRMKPEQFRSQKRGGKGAKGITTIENDYIQDVVSTSSRANLFFFTNKGRVYSIRAYQIPESTAKNSRGFALISLLQTAEDEAITSMVSVNDSIPEAASLVLATKEGFVKRMQLSELPSKIRSNGIRIMKFKKENDVLIGAVVTEDADKIMLTTKNGMCTNYSASLISIQSRNAGGVIGITLGGGDEVISMEKLETEKEVIVITEMGYAKRTTCSSWSLKKRKHSQRNLLQHPRFR